MTEESTVTPDEKREQNQADNSESATVKSEQQQMIPKSRFDAVNEQRKAALGDLEKLAKNMLEDVPEDLHDLVPNLPPADVIAWIRRAVKKGIFDRTPQTGLDSKRPGGKPPLDFSKMSEHEMMKAGYGK